MNSRWFADLIDFLLLLVRTRAKTLGCAPTASGEKYILVVQDVFSRFLYTEALPNKKPETVAAGFRKILGRAGTTPKALVTDKGGEFGQTFQSLLANRNITFQQKQKDDTNAIATLDTAIGNLKKGVGTRHQEAGDERLGKPLAKGHQRSKQFAK